MMVKSTTKFKVWEPYSLTNKGPTPQIDREEGLPVGALDIAWVDDSRKGQQNWTKGLKWSDRLHAHATMSSARRNVKCTRPFEPKDELDFVLDAVYSPFVEVFAEKGDPYIQRETAYGENLNIEIYKRKVNKQEQEGGLDKDKHDKNRLKRPQWQAPEKPEVESWRLMRNRYIIYPERPIPRSYPLKISTGGVERRENIYHVKLGIAAYHSPQTNPGYSRTPSGAFYSI